MSLLSRIEKLEKMGGGDQTPRIVWLEAGAPRSPVFVGHGSAGSVPVLYVGWKSEGD